MASELQNLAPFQGYGKIVGYNPFKVTIPKIFFDNQKGVKHFDPVDPVTIKNTNNPPL